MYHRLTLAPLFFVVLSGCGDLPVNPLGEPVTFEAVPFDGSVIIDRIPENPPVFCEDGLPINLHFAGEPLVEWIIPELENAICQWSRTLAPTPTPDRVTFTDTLNDWDILLTPADTFPPGLLVVVKGAADWGGYMAAAIAREASGSGMFGYLFAGRRFVAGADSAYQEEDWHRPLGEQRIHPRNGPCVRDCEVRSRRRGHRPRGPGSLPAHGWRRLPEKRDPDPGVQSLGQVLRATRFNGHHDPDANEHHAGVAGRDGLGVAARPDGPADCSPADALSRKACVELHQPGGHDVVEQVGMGVLRRCIPPHPPHNGAVSL